MEQYKQRIDEFRKMANFADQLEDANDDGRALAVRIALYDRVSDMAAEVQREIQARFGGEDGMNRAASAGGDDAMTKEAQWYNTLWKGIQGLGRGLKNLIRGGKPLGEEAAQKLFKGKTGAEALEAAGRLPADRGGILKNLRRLPEDWKGWRAGEHGFFGRGPAWGAGGRMVEAPTAMRTGLGLAGAGLAGAGALGMMGGHGREPEQQVGGYPGSPPGYPGSPPGYRAGPPIAYRDHGPGPMALPPSGMPTVYPPGGLVGPHYRDFQQVVSDLRDVDGRLGQLEARVQRIETGR